MKLAKATERIDPCLEGEAVVDTGGNATTGFLLTRA
jgi:hypothetical protein